MTYGEAVGQGIIPGKNEADWLLASICVNEARLGRPLTTEERAEILRLIREGHGT